MSKKHSVSRSSLTGYIMILPALVLYGVFVTYPIVQSIILSFHRWDGAAKVKQFVGGANYLQALKDPVVSLALMNNVAWAVGHILLAVLPGLIIAVVLARKLPGRVTFQTIFFLPRLFPMVVVSIVWVWIYNPVFGLINNTLRAAGLGSFTRGWLGDSQFALWATIIAGSWTYFGFCMVLFLAALQNVDQTLYDAARIDGANAVQIFIHVTVPQIRPVITLVIAYTVIDVFKVFDLIYIMTRGGPGNKTQLLATYTYRRAFRENYVGYGACIAVLLTILVLAISVVFIHYRERKV